MSEDRSNHTSSSGDGEARPGLSAYLSANRSETALLVSRLVTLYFSLNFLLPLFGTSQVVAYQRVMMASALTSSVRLYQRLAPNFRFSREQLQTALTEDSCHYLIFSIIFFPSVPNTVALLPILMFALLQSGGQYRKLLAVSGRSGPNLLNRLVSKLEANRETLFRFIAMSEIILMPIVVFMAFTGRVSIFVPFIFFKFLTLRYSSRRNPYSRVMFYELRVTIYHVSMKPQCPAFLRNVTHKAISFIARLAPATAPAQ